MTLSVLSTALEQHKVTCIFKQFTLFPSICFLHLSPSLSNPVSLRAFPLDPGTFQLILYVQNFSHFKGKPALLYHSQPNLFWQDTDFGFSFLLDDNSFSFFHYSLISLFNYLIYISRAPIGGRLSAGGWVYTGRAGTERRPNKCLNSGNPARVETRHTQNRVSR